MSDNEKLKQFHDCDYDELFNTTDHNDKFHKLLDMKPGDDPLENANRALYLVNHYNDNGTNYSSMEGLGCKDKMDDKFKNTMEEILSKLFNQIKNMQTKINTIENMAFDDKNFEKEYGKKKEPGWNKRSIAMDFECKTPCDNPLENLYRIHYMLSNSPREMGYFSIDAEMKSMELLDKSLQKLEELTKK